eukprot:TRINITY_DN1989_c0_g1_i1.p1 TRINITY_DN1989_c0_g1~~TRINITY_DN1989_c0_g1_i1.p1  ORF type:complete len:327 (+),score=44.72 TRINITY_DN1989_c0_g1_i1:45-1025(+)
MVRLAFECDDVVPRLQFEFEPKPGKSDFVRSQICRGLTWLLQGIEKHIDASSQHMGKLDAFLAMCNQVCLDASKSEGTMHASSEQCRVQFERRISVPPRPTASNSSCSSDDDLDSSDDDDLLGGSEAEWPSLESFDADANAEETTANAEVFAHQSSPIENKADERSSSKQSAPCGISAHAHAGIKPKIRCLPSLAQHAELPDTWEGHMCSSRSQASGMMMSSSPPQRGQSASSAPYRPAFGKTRSLAPEMEMPSSPPQPRQSASSAPSRPAFGKTRSLAPQPGQSASSAPSRPAFGKTLSDSSHRARHFEGRFGSQWPGADREPTS